ncbi:unnamed protein product, partial [Notodromas monacha]
DATKKISEAQTTVVRNQLRLDTLSKAFSTEQNALAGRIEKQVAKLIEDYFKSQPKPEPDPKILAEIRGANEKIQALETQLALRSSEGVSLREHVVGLESSISQLNLSVAIGPQDVINKLSELKTTIQSETGSKFASISSQIEQLTASKELLETAQVRAKTDLAQSLGIVEGLKSKLETLESTVGASLKSAEQTTAEIQKKLADFNQVLSSQISEVSTSDKSAVKRIEALEINLAAAQTTAQNLVAKNSEIKNSIDAISLKWSSVENLEKSNQQLEERIKDLRDIWKSSNNDFSDLQQKLTKLEAQISADREGLRSQLYVLEQNIKRQQTQDNDNLLRIVDTSKASFLASQELTDKRLAIFESDIKRISDTDLINSKTIKALEESFKSAESLKTDIQDVLKRVTLFEQLASTTRDQLNALEGTVSGSVTTSQKEFQDLKTESSRLSTNLDGIVNRLQSQTQIIESLKTEILGLKDATNAVAAADALQISRIDSLLGEQAQKIQNLKKLIETDISKIEAQETRLSSLASTCDLLSRRLRNQELVSVSNWPKNCQDWKNRGATSSGIYTIDPDGSGVGESAFMVECNMETGATVIPHNLNLENQVARCLLPGCEVRKVNYQVTISQIKALKEVSTSCQQEIKVNCLGATLSAASGTQNAWWVGIDGSTRNYNWHRSATGESAHFCACQETRTCQDPALTCNCDSSSNVRLSDVGSIDDISKLPITELHFGGVSEIGNQMMSYTLGNFFCTGKKDPISTTSTCKDLFAAGNQASGMHWIDGPPGSEKVELVVCKMAGQTVAQSPPLLSLVRNALTFNCRRMHSYAKAKTVIPFDSVVTNHPDSVHKEAGTVTVRTPGVYYVRLTVDTYGILSTLVCIRKNGVNEACVFGKDDGGQSQGTILFCQANDVLDSYLVHGAIAESSQQFFTQFSGFLLWAS